MANTNFKRDLDYYKKNIPLADFLIQNYGFEEATKSTPRQRRLKRYEINGVKSEHSFETIIVYKNKNEHYNYMSVMESYIQKDIVDEHLKTKGINANNLSTGGKTIIDFLQKEHSTRNKFFDLFQVRKFLENYLNSEKYISPTDSKFIVNAENKINKDQLLIQLNECEPFFNYPKDNYFERRGISNETIRDEQFFPMIKRKDFFDKNSGITYNNVAYLMTNFDGISALALKNNESKGYAKILGDRTGLFLSTNKNKNIEKLFITEAAEDSLSHYQLYKPNSEEIRYCSTCGTMSDSQTELLEKIIKEYQPKKLVIGFDNDLAGEFFRAKLIGKLQVNDTVASADFLDEYKNFSKSIIDCSIDNNKGGSNKGLVTIIIPSANQEEGIKQISELREMLGTFNEKLNTVEGDGFLCHVKSIEENISTARIEFKSIKEHWKAIGDFIEEIKYEKGTFIERETPLLKDFNEDLKASLGMIRVKDGIIENQFNNDKNFKPEL